MQQFRLQRNCCIKMLLALLGVVATAAAEQQTVPNGYIPPPSKVPEFDPAAWNQAYKLTLRNVSAACSSQELLQSLRFPNTMLRSIQLPQDCSSQGFDTVAPATVALVSGLVAAEDCTATAITGLAAARAASRAALRSNEQQ